MKKESELASGMRGIEGAALSRKYIKLRKRNEEKGLQEFFANLAKSNMQLSKVNHIQNLLTKDYSERTNAYEIKSKISPDQRRRVH